MQNNVAEDVTYNDPNEKLGDSVNNEPFLSTDSIGSAVTLEDAAMNAETVRRAETAERYRLNLKPPSAQDFSDISKQDGLNSSISNFLTKHARDMTAWPCGLVCQRAGLALGQSSPMFEQEVIKSRWNKNQDFLHSTSSSNTNVKLGFIQRRDRGFMTFSNHHQYSPRLALCSMPDERVRGPGLVPTYEHFFEYQLREKLVNLVRSICP